MMPRLLVMFASCSLALLALGCGEEVTSADEQQPSSNDASGPGGKGDIPGIEAPEDTFLDHYPLAVEHPESGIYDAYAHAFYVGSLVDGGVWKIDAGTGEVSPFYVEERPGKWWTLGLDVDLERRVLWTCSMSDLRDVDGAETDNLGYLLEHDLESGELLALFDLSETFEEATCADVAVGADGTAYVVDRSHPNVYQISLDDEVSIFASDPLLEGGVVGQNAVVVLPDQSALLTIVYYRPKLLRVDLEDGSVTRVDLDGDFFDHFPVLAGADGMTVSGDDVLVMFSSELTRVTPDSPEWKSARSDSMDIESGHTDIIHTPYGDFMLNGQALAFAFGGELDPFSLTLAPEFE